MEYINKNGHEGINKHNIKKMLWYPCENGTHWQIFTRLIKKQVCLIVSINSNIPARITYGMNKLIKYKLRVFASKILCANVYDRDYDESKRKTKGPLWH